MPVITNIIIGPASSATACELLARSTGLSKSRIKEAMGKGGVWLRTGRTKRRRLRRATAVPAGGDILELFYDENLLARKPPSARCLHDERHYSLWHKPVGLLAQGNDYGDHCSLLRQAELALQRPAYPVHRLDREAAGLMLIAHQRQAAAGLSRLFRENGLRKYYEIRVAGRPDPPQGAILLPLDGRPAHTEYALLHHEPATASSLVAVELKTGRRHQIRRHFHLFGHPVLGDSRYGTGNKNTEGLQLEAVGLAFRCPCSGRQLSFTVPAELRLISPSLENGKPSL
jgi:tRNA pseudouridine32 synthase / 23S rRNA pseudouridine746 synthase